MANHDSATQPALCQNNCGFFGRNDQRNLCSKCYGELIQSEAPAAAQQTIVPEPDVNTITDFPAPSTAPAVIADIPTISAAIVEKARNRCEICRKKLRLAQQFECLCKMTFCGQHRYADAHECGFDYKKRNQEQLRKDNPEIIASKISKI
jgi:hypothetical protein